MTMAEAPVGQAKKLPEQDLADKLAVVTGGTKGIGRAIALNLATRGASVLATFSSSASLNHFSGLKAEIETLFQAANIPAPKLVGVSANITDVSSVDTIFEALTLHFDARLDILVLSAAVMGLTRMGEGSIDNAFLDRFMAGNLKFPILLVDRLVASRSFRAASRVVAVSSEAVRARRPPGGSVYAATKAGLESLMRSWAYDFGKRPGMEGTTFNAVSVGFTKTDAYQRIPREVRTRLEEEDAKEVAVGNRIGESEDVADVVGLLVSEKARWISGSVVDASGGKAHIF